MTIDGSTGGSLFIVNALERNESLGCLNIMASLDPAVGQPCSGCLSDDFPVDSKEFCTCGNEESAAIMECCTYS